MGIEYACFRDHTHIKKKLPSLKNISMSSFKNQC